jgi:hypothetical protein
VALARDGGTFFGVIAAAEISTSHALRKHWPRDVRERCRLAYVGGMVRSLMELSEKAGVPHDTLRRWCRAERWGELEQQADAEATQNLGEWLSTERGRQMKRAVERARKLQAAIDTSVGNRELTPSELRDMTTAEERADAIIRRNLGMNDSMASGSTVSVAVLSSIQVAA